MKGKFVMNKENLQNNVYVGKENDGKFSFWPGFEYYLYLVIFSKINFNLDNI